MTEDITYIPLSQETLATIQKLKKEDESIQDFIKRVIENFLLQEDVESAQLEKMKELWDNKENDIWEKMV